MAPAKASGRRGRARRLEIEDLAAAACARLTSRRARPMAAARQSYAASALAKPHASVARRAGAGRRSRPRTSISQARARTRDVLSFRRRHRAKSFRIGREKDGAERLRLAQSAGGSRSALRRERSAAPLCHTAGPRAGCQARGAERDGPRRAPHMVELLRRAARRMHRSIARSAPAARDRAPARGPGGRWVPAIPRRAAEARAQRRSRLTRRTSLRWARPCGRTARRGKRGRFADALRAPIKPWPRGRPGCPGLGRRRRAAVR